MEIILAIVVGILTAGGLYLLLEARAFPMLIGTLLLSHAATLVLLASGGVSVRRTAIVRSYIPVSADPVPQALVLAFLAVTFSLTVVAMAILVARAWPGKGEDR